MRTMQERWADKLENNVDIHFYWDYPYSCTQSYLRFSGPIEEDQRRPYNPPNTDVNDLISVIHIACGSI
jgi:hypothetical protein